jgi:hypothetical protein
MAKVEPGLESRIAVLENEVRHLTEDVRALTPLIEKVSKLEGRAEGKSQLAGERTSGDTLKWVRAGVYVALAIGAVGTALAIVTFLVLTGHL